MRSTPLMRHRQGGFTLIEAGIATVVVGIGIVALVHSLGAGTEVNHQGQNMTQAVFLAQAVREWTLRLPFKDAQYPDSPPGKDASDTAGGYDDLDDLKNTTFCPPRDGNGSPMNDLLQWRQTIQLDWRDPNLLTATVPEGSSDTVYVTVTITCAGQQVLQTGWLVTRRAS